MGELLGTSIQALAIVVGAAVGWYVLPVVLAFWPVFLLPLAAYQLYLLCSNLRHGHGAFYVRAEKP